MENTKISPSTPDLRSQFCQTTRLYTTRKKYNQINKRNQDVNKNEIKFLGKTWGNIEYNGETTKNKIYHPKK